MFEKEAEDNKPPYAYCAIDTKCELWKDGFQKGAEYGYNKANEELKLQIEQMKLCQNCRFEFYDDMEEPCRNCSRCLGEDIKREGDSDKWEIKEND